MRIAVLARRRLGFMAGESFRRFGNGFGATAGLAGGSGRSMGTRFESLDEEYRQLASNDPFPPCLIDPNPYHSIAAALLQYIRTHVLAPKPTNTTTGKLDMELYESD